MRRVQRIFSAIMVLIFGFMPLGIAKAVKQITVNLLIVGERGVGKTSLMQRIYNKNITAQHDDLNHEMIYAPDVSFDGNAWPRVSKFETVGYRYRGDEICLNIKEMNINDPNIEVEYKKANIILYVFDLSSDKTVNELSAWYDTVMRLRTGQRNFSIGEIINRNEINEWYKGISDTVSDCYIEFVANKHDNCSHHYDYFEDKLNEFVGKLPNAGYVPTCVNTGFGLKFVLIDGIFETARAGFNNNRYYFESDLPNRNVQTDTQGWCKKFLVAGGAIGIFAVCCICNFFPTS